jgi:hypothetical protein
MNGIDLTVDSYSCAVHANSKSDSLRFQERPKRMGELFIQKPTGESITFHQDGTVTQEVKPLEIDWCDKCQKWQPLADGRFEKHDGLTILWFCGVCK